MADNIITVNNLSKVYKLYNNTTDRLKESLHPLRKKYHRDFYALNNINFDVQKGESIGIIGKNGSGKSTLLKILTGVLTPTSGDIMVNGKVSALLELGAGFNPELTGIENIYFSGTIMGYTRMEMDAKIDGILAFADIGEFVHQPVKMYSSGMFVRLAFANAISVDPDILIVDEALSVGDIFFQQKCHARMEKLIQNGATIIVVSHDMPSIEKYSDKVLLLDRGQCMFMGNPNEAVHRYYASLHDTPVAAEPTVAEEVEGNRDNKDAVYKQIKDWPPDHAFLDLSDAVIIGHTDVVKCTGIAVCNEAGQSCTSFRLGETAYFYFEFEALQDIDVPLGGIEIISSMNLVLYSKSSIHYLLDAPAILEKGRRIRFRQTIKMQLFIGEYTFIVGLATIKKTDYDHAQEMESDVLYSKINPVLRVSRTGKIMITEQEHGLKLPFYGYVDLAGSLTCELQAN